MDEHRLTDDERKVLELIVEAVNLYNTLPVQHPAHKQEFTTSVHQLQRLIMSRPTARIEGWDKPDYKLDVLPPPASNSSQFHLGGNK